MADYRDSSLLADLLAQYDNPADAFRFAPHNPTLDAGGLPDIDWAARRQATFNAQSPKDRWLDDHNRNMKNFLASALQYAPMALGSRSGAGIGRDAVMAARLDRAYPAERSAYNNEYPDIATRPGTRAVESIPDSFDPIFLAARKGGYPFLGIRESANSNTPTRTTSPRGGSDLERYVDAFMDQRAVRANRGQMRAVDENFTPSPDAQAVSTLDKQLNDLRQVRGTLENSDYEGAVRSMSPAMRTRYMQSLSPYDQAMHYITWTPKGWPEMLSPGHVALQSALIGGGVYAGHKAGVWDPAYDIADQVRQNMSLVDMLKDYDGAPRDAIQARIDANRTLRNEPVAGNAPY